MSKRYEGCERIRKRPKMHVEIHNSYGLERKQDVAGGLADRCFVKKENIPHLQTSTLSFTQRVGVRLGLSLVHLDFYGRMITIRYIFGPALLVCQGGVTSLLPPTLNFEANRQLYNNTSTEFSHLCPSPSISCFAFIRLPLFG